MTRTQREPDHASETPDNQCEHGRISGDRCPLAASWFPRNGDHRGKCTWHAELEHAPHADTFEEFERFCLRLRDAGYCTVWTHYTPVILWDFIHHKVRNTPVKHPCERPGCPFALREVKPPSRALASANMKGDRVYRERAGPGHPANAALRREVEGP